MSSRLLVPFRLTVCGLEELAGAAGVSHVLSILDPGLPSPAAFAGWGPLQRLDLRFHDVIDAQPDMVMPAPADIDRLLAFGRAHLADGCRHLLVHCHAGVSRSTAALTLLLAQARPDRPAAAALAEVVRLRPQAWPNLRMIELGDRQLGRGGDLVAAARARYRAVLAEDPGRAAAMAAAGRGREVS